MECSFARAMRAGGMMYAAARIAESKEQPTPIMLFGEGGFKPCVTKFFGTCMQSYFILYEMD